ncbi:hypothetical protein A4A49_29926 [Nicotiana attenuata]|uniref:Uncharacterized protein n=1 Tax=Nicotiana attenuata TaxID=49451 RepID=A0A1J6IKC0_NICAT|nr:hypothetical protein A4A49_29926 [Nicotiana attenuata]
MPYTLKDAYVSWCGRSGTLQKDISYYIGLHSVDLVEIKESEMLVFPPILFEMFDECIFLVFSQICT